MSCEESNVHKPYAVGVVLPDDEEGTGNNSGRDLGLGLSKRWGNQDGDWPVVASIPPPPRGGPVLDKDGDWSAKMDDDVQQYLWDIPAESSVFDKQTADSQERIDLTQNSAMYERGQLNKGGASFSSINSGSVPGAYEVRDRIGGFLFGRAAVENAHSDDDDDYSQYSDFELFDTHFSRWRIAVGLVCMVFLGLAIGLGIVVLSPDSQGIGLGEEFGRGAGGAECNFSGILQPDPFHQCACTGNMTMITDELLSRYQDLRQGFLPLVLPDYEEKSAAPNQTASCAPYNFALMWLAFDSLGKSDDFKVMQNRYALAVLYAEWDGAHWTKNEGWLSVDEQECNWHGVHCKHPSTVSSLTLNDNLLKGTIPSEIAILQDLVKLDISENSLEGGIPDELYNMSTLEDLVLWSNELEGTISSSIGYLSNLKELSLDSNHFSGTLPHELTFLDNMIWFMVDMNDFTGEVFDFALSWPDLVGFTVGGNDFNGTIPELFGALQTSVRILDVSATEITGTLPTELGNLVELEDFSMDGNLMEGTIPTEIGNWKSLKNVALTFGKLRGPIPTEVGRLTYLEKMYLGENSLTGSIPTEFGLCTQLLDLHLEGNDISGQVPTELGSLSRLKTLNLGWTDLTGVAPPEICSLRQLDGDGDGDGDLVSFFAPCHAFQCDPSTCCKRCCVAGCG